VSKRSFAALIRWALAMVMPMPLSCVLASCSQTDNPNVWYNKTMVENLGSRTTAAPNAADQVVAPAAPVMAASAGPPMAAPGGVATPATPSGPVPPGELYWSEISCGTPGPAPTAAGMRATAAATMAPTPNGVALQMTECDVARRSGRPDKVELSAANGMRMLTLAYLRGPQPRVYHFVAGRLVSIDYVPRPSLPPRKRHADQARAM